MANQSSLQCGRGPREIMSWTEELYKPVFSAMTHSGQAFALREHDYVFGDHKFGGSAQGSCVGCCRFRHHSAAVPHCASSMPTPFTMCQC